MATAIKESSRRSPLALLSVKDPPSPSRGSVAKKFAPVYFKAPASRPGSPTHRASSAAASGRFMRAPAPVAWPKSPPQLLAEKPPASSLGTQHRSSLASNRLGRPSFDNRGQSTPTTNSSSDGGRNSATTPAVVSPRNPFKTRSPSPKLPPSNASPGELRHLHRVPSSSPSFQRTVSNLSATGSCLKSPGRNLEQNHASKTTSFAVALEQDEKRQAAEKTDPPLRVAAAKYPLNEYERPVDVERVPMDLSEETPSNDDPRSASTTPLQPCAAPPKRAIETAEAAANTSFFAFPGSSSPAAPLATAELPQPAAGKNSFCASPGSPKPPAGPPAAAAENSFFAGAAGSPNAARRPPQQGSPPRTSPAPPLPFEAVERRSWTPAFPGAFFPPDAPQQQTQPGAPSYGLAPADRASREVTSLIRAISSTPSPVLRYRISANSPGSTVATVPCAVIVEVRALQTATLYLRHDAPSPVRQHQLPDADPDVRDWHVFPLAEVTNVHIGTSHSKAFMLAEAGVRDAGLCLSLFSEGARRGEEGGGGSVLDLEFADGGFFEAFLFVLNACVTRQPDIASSLAHARTLRGQQERARQIWQQRAYSTKPAIGFRAANPAFVVQG
ncbi:hypothetical protein DIPPA_34287 [Diplonema papillatum]|nr:hypothetical protein DIPPA_34287 [Diplonema papillatum]|eukprot:gene17723-27277_t